MKGRVPTLGTPPPPPGSANESVIDFRYHRCCSCERYNPQHLVLTLNDTCVCVSQRHLVAMIKGVNRCHKLGRFLCLFIFQQRTTYQEGIFDFHYELEVILVIIFLITLKFFGNVQITIENNYN